MQSKGEPSEQRSVGKRPQPSGTVAAHMRSDLMEKTGVHVNVKSLLAPWLARHCAWSQMRFAICTDKQTAFKRQRCKDNVGETACFGEAIGRPLRIQTKMEPRWEPDDVFLGKLDLSDEVSVAPQKALRRHDYSDECQQINNGTQRLRGCLSGHREARGASLLTHLEGFANVT